MNAQDTPHPSRRFLLSAASLAAACAVGPRSAIAAQPPATVADHEPFWGEHQAGIVTKAQSHIYFAAFDVIAAKRSDLAALLRQWTEAAARLTSGQPAGGADSGDAQGLGLCRLTLTIGFGPGLFSSDGHDRFGLAARCPQALAALPAFPGDQLQPARCGGDLSVQACADDPQVAFHAIRQLARLADGVALVRWVQAGFSSAAGSGTPRNLMGFKDGTGNLSSADPAALDRHVWVGNEGPSWMQGGTYLVARRSRIALEHWDRTPTGFQEQTIGRRKDTGAPLGRVRETDPLDLAATDGDGNLVVPENAHVRLANAASNGGARILRRSYSYNDGVSLTAERWPPWHQGMEYDAGLLFLCYQRDPRTGFVAIFEKMAKFDMMNQFVTNVGSALFACPPGARPGRYIGQDLLA